MVADFTAYRHTFGEYMATLKGCSLLTHDMLQFEQTDWCEHFKLWNRLYVYMVLLKGVVVFVAKDVGKPLGTGWAFLLSFILNYCVYTLLATHLAWFVILRSYGCCGKTGYIVIAVMYLAMGLSHVGYLSITAYPFATLLEFVIAIIAFAILICSIFVSLACFKLFEGVPGQTQPLMRSDEVGEPLQEVSSGSLIIPVQPLHESPSQELLTEDDEEDAGEPLQKFTQATTALQVLQAQSLLRADDDEVGQALQDVNTAATVTPAAQQAPSEARSSSAEPESVSLKNLRPADHDEAGAGRW